MTLRPPVEVGAARRVLPTWAAAYAAAAPVIRGALKRTSFTSGISERDLDKKLLLHLPRLTHEQLLDSKFVSLEAERLASRVWSARSGFEEWQARPAVLELLRGDVTLRECEVEIAQHIHERFHYIGSFHPGVAHLGIFLRACDDVPAAMASLAPMDIHALGGALASPDARRRALVVSRVYAFDWAPRNIISFLLARLARWVKANLPEVESLFTFLNPNLGFRGSSLLASNWEPFQKLPPLYSYLGDEYLSYRALCAAGPPARAAAKGCAYELRHLMLFRCRLIDRSARGGKRVRVSSYQRDTA